MFTKKDENNLFIKSIVLASMKEGKVYTVKFISNLRGDFSEAVCGCPAGVDGRCNHFAATLFAIEDKQNNEVFTSAANAAGAVNH